MSTDHSAPGATLGFWTCTALVVGNTIGVGVFLLPAALAPFGLNAMSGWGVTAIGCLVLAQVFASLARAMPGEDGPFGYIRRTQGETAAFVAIWGYWVSVWVTNATIPVSIVGYVQAAFPSIAGHAPPLMLALGLQWLFVLVNLFGLRAGGFVQIVTTVLKLLPLAGIVLLGLWLLIAHPVLYAAHTPVTPMALGPTTQAATLALYAMLGLECAAVPAGRVRDPGRTIPRATLAGTALTAAIYVAVSIIPMLLIPQAELAKSSAPFVDLLDRYLAAGSGRWLAMFVVVSGLGALNGWTLLAGEVSRTMAINGVLPIPLAQVNRRGAPALALVVTGVLASAMVLMNYSRSLVAGFSFLSLMVTAACLPLYLLCAVAIVVLWRRERRSAPVMFLVVGGLSAAYVLFAFAGAGAEPLLWTAVLAAAGLPLFLLMRRRRPAQAAS
ncbi:amino acid permease [Phenylobacterium montanum]|uniref:Arginine/agmatine antiporter n=1 Tax=Phenylobacterium montanum TaxID=2823693 RepID=A0A975IW79_9CAUL|nr:amino acid permease [Caulobacter sp. S6]QUD89324.1 amino acid permease [Caulobacter sp. S6]